MKNSFFSRFTPKEPKFFPLLKQLSEILANASDMLAESLLHDSPDERADYYKRIKDLERDGDKLTHRIFDELGTTFITPFDREDIHDLASSIDDVIDRINSCAKRIHIYNPRPIYLPEETRRAAGVLLQAARHREPGRRPVRAFHQETFRGRERLHRDHQDQGNHVRAGEDDRRRRARGQDIEKLHRQIRVTLWNY